MITEYTALLSCRAWLLKTHTKGFGLSEKATLLYAERKGIKLYEGRMFCGSREFYTDPSLSDDSYYYPTYCRHDPDLVAVVEELGTEEASGMCAKLMIEHTTSNRYMIEEYDGRESVRVDYNDDEWEYIP